MRFTQEQARLAKIFEQERQDNLEKSVLTLEGVKKNKDLAPHRLPEWEKFIVKGVMK